MFFADHPVKCPADRPTDFLIRPPEPNFCAEASPNYLPPNSLERVTWYSVGYLIWYVMSMSPPNSLVPTESATL